MSQQKVLSMTYYKTRISPPCRFVHMVIKHLNIDCEINNVDYLGGQHKTPEFAAINPAKTIPALKDGDLCLGERWARKISTVNSTKPFGAQWSKKAVKSLQHFSNCCYFIAKLIRKYTNTEKWAKAQWRYECLVCILRGGKGNSSTLKYQKRKYWSWYNRWRKIFLHTLSSARFSIVNWNS